MSHNIITPLTRISTNVQTANKKEGTDHERLAGAQADVMLIKDMVSRALFDGRKEDERP